MQTFGGRSGRLTAAVAAVVAMTGLLAACSSGTASSNASTTLPPSNTTTTAPTSTTSSTAASASTTTSATAVQNLTVTPAVRATLTSTFVAYKNIAASDITGTAPDSVYYAYDPTTQTYWALAQFTPNTSAPTQVLVGMQDGGDFGLFSMHAGAAWTVQTGGYPPPCAEAKYFPATVMEVWGLPQPTASMGC